MTDSVSRALLLRWLGWFIAANAVVLGIVGLRYLGGMDIGHTNALTWLYVATAYLSHSAVLAGTALLVLVPLITLLPRPRLVLAMGAVLMALFAAGITLDSLLWAQSRFHLNLLTMRILGAPSWTFGTVMFGIALLFESFLARSVWRWVCAARSHRGWLAGGLIGASFLAAQGIHAWADASYYTPVTTAPVHLPAYRGITAKSLMRDSGLVDVQFSRERSLAEQVSRDIGGSTGLALNYPLTPLKCTPQDPFNLLIIVIDALRSDTVSAEITPRIESLAAHDALRFEQHFSGGNSSRIGMFSLFYALPPGYFDSVEASLTPAVLTSELQSQGFQFGIFSSSSLVRPAALDRTVFARVPDLDDVVPDQDIPHAERVVMSRDQWRRWIASYHSPQPFFSFLYLDSSRRAAPPGTVPATASGAERELAEYQAAMHANDALVGSVIDELKERDLWDRTIVLITADHGEQFGEHGEEIIGHGSLYSREQLQVPLVLHWPGMQPRTIEERTSHYDIVPTLMSRLLGCSNPATDYSSGADLLDGMGWDWLLAGSYYNYAIVEPDQVTITFPNGTYEMRDWNYAILDKPRFRASVMQAIIEENSRFHR